MRNLVLSALIALSCLSVSNLALAEDRGGAARGGGAHPDYHGRDIHSFTPQEHDHWRTGHWEHGWHDGRFAWWWSLDGIPINAAIGIRRAGNTGTGGDPGGEAGSGTAVRRWQEGRGGGVR